MATEDEAAQIARRYAGLTAEQARAFVKAVIAGARAEALELIAGAEAVPTSLADTRALRLRYVCQELGRPVRSREVEVIFRVTPSTAAGILRRMQATYMTVLEELFQSRLRESGRAVHAGNLDDPRYEISFEDETVLDYARQVLEREGMTRGVTVRRSTLVLDVPNRIEDRTGKQRDVAEVLGIPVEEAP
jgi:hypothetical protein